MATDKLTQAQREATQYVDGLQDIPQLTGRDLREAFVAGWQVSAALAQSPVGVRLSAPEVDELGGLANVASNTDSPKAWDALIAFVEQRIAAAVDAVYEDAANIADDEARSSNSRETNEAVVRIVKSIQAAAIRARKGAV